RTSITDSISTRLSGHIVKFMRVSSLSFLKTAPYSLFALPLHETRPVRVSLGEISLGILVEIVSNAFAVLQQQATFEDLESFWVDFDEFVARNPVGAKAPVRWLVLLRLFVEQRLVFR